MNTTLLILSNIYLIFASLLVLTLHSYYRPLLRYGKTLKKPKRLCSNFSVENFILSLHTPKQYFSHFYFFGLIWLLIYTTTILPQLHHTNYIVIGIYSMQLTRRFIECIHTPSRSESRMHLFHYFAGFLFYTVTPIILLSNDGSIQVYSFSFTAYFMILMILMYDQHSIHTYLYGLRQNKKPAFPIAFKYTLFPHYTCEIAIYVILSLLSSCGPSIVVWVCVNLVVSANEQYKWYSKEFGKDVIGSRKRMLAFIW